MKIIITTIVLSFIITLTQGQLLTLNTGITFYKSKTIVPVLHQTNNSNQSGFYSINFDYLYHKRKYLVGTAYSFFKGWTNFGVDTDFWAGNGSSATTVNRFELLFGYNLLNHQHEISFGPIGKVIFEKTIKTGSSGERAYINDEVDPNFEGPIILEAFDSFQILPALGLDFSWAIFKGLHLHANAYYAFGHKPYQKYYFEYTYDGVPQSTAEWHSNGTGLFTTMGLGIKLFENGNQ